MSRPNGPWTIHTTTIIHRDTFIELSQDEVTRPDGRRGNYAVVKMKPGAAVLPIDAERNVYLVKQFRYALGRESLEVVSGGIDGGETPAEAARREALEEAGVEAATVVPLGTIEMDTSIILNPVHQFLAEDIMPGTPKRESTEIMETIRMPLEEAVRKVMNGEIFHGPSCVLILKAFLRLGQISM